MKSYHIGNIFVIILMILMVLFITQILTFVHLLIIGSQVTLLFIIIGRKLEKKEIEIWEKAVITYYETIKDNSIEQFIENSETTSGLEHLTIYEIRRIIKKNKICK